MMLIKVVIHAYVITLIFYLSGWIIIMMHYKVVKTQEPKIKGFLDDSNLQI